MVFLLFIIALPIIVCLIALSAIFGVAWLGFLIHYWGLGLITLFCCILAAIHGWKSGEPKIKENPKGLSDDRKQKIAELNARAHGQSISYAERICRREHKEKHNE